MKALAKKICMYFLCTCLISASVFMSYDNTMKVRAINTDYSEWEAAESITGIALALVGIVGTVSTGFSLPALAAVAGGVFATVDGIDGLKNMLIDNGDGTFTMTPEFIQLVLDEAKKIDETGFHDYESIKDISGNYVITGFNNGKSGNDIVNIMYNGTSEYKPFLYVNHLTNPFGGSSDSCTFEHYTGDGTNHSYARITVKYTQYINGKLDVSNGSTYQITGTDYGVNIPMYTNISDFYAAVQSGDYSKSLNYREKMFEYGSIYAPIYTGGSVRISKQVLDRFEDKLKEVNEKYDSVDDKINALYEYIFNNDSGSSGGGTGFDFDFDIDSPFDLGNLFNGLFKDWSDFGTTFITSLADFFKELADGMKKKFPFSIPWDIYHIFTVFSNVDSPKAADISTISFTDINSGISVYTVDSEDMEQDVHDAPYFKLPIKVESFGIYEEIIVDMKDFQSLSTFSRTMFSLLFAVFLLKFTIKILSIFGVFGGDD